MNWKLKLELKNFLRAEKGTIFKDAPLKIVLLSPSKYAITHSSLGFQWVYALFNKILYISCERVVFPENFSLYRKYGEKIVSIETQTPLNNFKFIGVSLTYELEFEGFIKILLQSKIEPLREKRRDKDPLIIAGGPQMLTSPLAFAPFVDLFVIGDGEGLIEEIGAALLTYKNKENFFEKLKNFSGIYIPEIHKDRVSQPNIIDSKFLEPAKGQIITPFSEFKDMFLIEVSRGCPRICKFCIVQKDLFPPRFFPKDKILSQIGKDVKRIGLVGTSVSDHPEIKEILKELIERKVEVSLSSLRADRLDEEFLELLSCAGYKTLTISADAVSERLRKEVKKGIKEKHILEVANISKKLNFRKLKLYILVGLPNEKEEDIEEFIELCKAVSSILPLSVSISPFVPKKRTPFENEKMEDVEAIQKKINLILKKLKGRSKISWTSPRIAHKERSLNNAGAEEGMNFYKKILLSF